MYIASLVLAALLLQSAPPQSEQPRRISPDSLPAKTEYRQLQKGEQQVEGLLQRVVCPGSGPVAFMVKIKDRAEKFEAARLQDVEFIAHTPDFRGPMSCGGRGAGDRVLVTWKKSGTARRVVAVEFLPRNR